MTQCYPPSFDQTRLWFLWRLEPDSSDYNLCRAVRVRGRLDVPALRRALDAIAARHEVLRTSLPERDGHPVQLVAAAGPIPLPVTEVGGEAAAREAIAGEAHGPFDLTSGPLFRARLLRLAEEEHVLVLVFHHVVVDGVSLAIFFDELSALYEAALRSEASPLAPLPAQYADYAAGQGDAAATARLEADLAYWRRHLAGAPSLVELPADRPRPALHRAGGAVAIEPFPRETWDAVGALCARERASPFMGFLAGYAALLSRLGAGADVVIGAPVSGRTRAEHEALLGYFANTLPIRIDLAGDPPFREILRRTRRAVLDALAHQDVPFQKLVEALAPERSVSHAPIVQTIFTAEHAAPPLPRLPGADVELLELGEAAARLDLMVHVAPAPWRPDGPSHHLTITYNVDLFEPASIDRLADRYVVLLGAAAAAPETRLSAIPLLGPAERARVLAWSREADGSSPVELVHAAVARRAGEEPDRPAVEHGQRRVSYGELDAWAARLALRLRALGAGPERVVGVLLPRSVELVVAELGVLRAGAAYLPLDPAIPARRLEAVLRDAGAMALVTTAALAREVGGTAAPAIVDVGAVDGEAPAPPAIGPDPRSLAYVIATSGSTGVPKVVMVEHRSLAQMAGWYRDLLGVGAGDRLSMLFSPGFDGSVSEIWGALAAGATSCIAEEEARFSGPRFQRWADDSGITVAGMPVPVSEEVLALPWRREASLRVFYTGADRLTKRPRSDAPFRVLNVYGPTEDTFGSTVADVPADEAGLPHIGRQVRGTAAYVLDSALGPVGVGVAGELYLGGAGLARGYLGHPAMTAERFVPHPFAETPGQRLYRTGDVVRWRADGNLEFVGRSDDQLKIRGFRIEPAEVEAALRADPSVAAAHVCAVRPGAAGEARLVAYIVPAAAAPAPLRVLRERLSRSLPGYMVPEVYVELDRLPLTTRGKIDRAALPVPYGRLEQAEYEAPATALERSLAAIWQQVLGVRRVGVRDNFFDLGGHSLLLVAVQRRIARDVGRDVPILTLFQRPTIADLAGHLRGERHGEDRPVDERDAEREAGRSRLRLRRQQLAGKSPRETP